MKPGRKKIGNQLRIRVSKDTQEYIERVRVAYGLNDTSAAGRLILDEANAIHLLLPNGVGTTVASEP